MNKIWFFGWFCLVPAGWVSGEGPPVWKMIHAGKLLAIPDQQPLTRATIVIKDGLVHQVTQGFMFPESHEESGGLAVVIDLTDAFVLPGLIDCHTHLLNSEGSFSLAGLTRWSDARWALRALPNLEATLKAGFTTVRDVGSINGAIYDLREAVAAGLVPGPRIVATREMLTPTGGHGDHGRFRPEIETPELLSVCDGPYDCRQKVREMAFRGAEFIKIKVSGGVLSGSGLYPDDIFFEDELREIVRTAHSLRLRVTAHALTGESLHSALVAGVDAIEHGQGLLPASLELFKRNGVFLVPTLMAAASIGADGDPHGDERGRWLADVPRLNKEAAKLAYQAGVKLAFGTDAGIIPHGQNAREFRYLVEIGITPKDAVVMATVRAAELLNLSAEIGSLEPGKRADLIAVQGDPLADITLLEGVRFVMKDGRIFVDEK